METRDSLLSDDERLARDMQLALDLQATEELASMRPAYASHENELHRGGGFMTHLNVEHMLFVTCEVEGRHIDMLVDSGACSSVIPLRLVRELGLGSHLNENIQGDVSGIGSSSIVGVLEDVACQIGHVEFKLFFLVLPTTDPWVILGLEQMKRFKCLIDLDSNNLTFGGKDGVSVPFLAGERVADLLSKKNALDRERASHQKPASRKLGSLFGRKKVDRPESR